VKEEFDESAVEKVKKIKKKRTVTKVKKSKTLSPLKFALANLLEFQVGKQTHPDTIELCCAADALDEFLKREMATRMIKALRDRKTEAVEKEKEDKVQEEKEAARKRKREEEDAARKKERKAEEDKLREEWAEDDDGKTDEEKRESMMERQQILKEKRMKWATEDKERLEKEKAEVAEDDKGKPVKKLQTDVHPKEVDAFSYFDRVPGYAKMMGTLPRLKIENLLLCVDEDLTLEEISSLMDIPQIPKKQAQVAYKAIATAQKYIEVKPAEDEQMED